MLAWAVARAASPGLPRIPPTGRGPWVFLRILPPLLRPELDLTELDPALELHIEASARDG